MCLCIINRTGVILSDSSNPTAHLAGPDHRPHSRNKQLVNIHYIIRSGVTMTMIIYPFRFFLVFFSHPNLLYRFTIVAALETVHMMFLVFSPLDKFSSNNVSSNEVLQTA